jgi:23S rRNA (cytosine1962-C5)-methyltransferase
MHPGHPDPVRPPTFDPPDFPDHTLLDSGDGEKVERFGRVTLRRPDPQALWRPRRGPDVWAADLVFERESDRGGHWRAREGAPPEARGSSPEWTVSFAGATFVVRPTPFKLVGLFPEQAANWAWMLERARGLPEGSELLNLFGYTGAASVLAARAGLAVTHVDASKTSVAWTRENAERSGLSDRGLRLVVDDALAFATREVRRGRRYAGVLVDPPHYGRGPKGEKWQLETGLAPLLEAVSSLVAERAFVVLSTYAVGYSPLAFWNVLSELEGGETDVRELALPEERGGRLLPCGFCARWWRDA